MESIKQNSECALPTMKLIYQAIDWSILQGLTKRQSHILYSLDDSNLGQIGFHAFERGIGQLIHRRAFKVNGFYAT